LVEQLICNHQVGGSSPFTGSSVYQQLDDLLFSKRRVPTCLPTFFVRCGGQRGVRRKIERFFRLGCRLAELFVGNFVNEYSRSCVRLLDDATKSTPSLPCIAVFVRDTRVASLTEAN
jgi:hypothetical protein